MFFWQSLLGRSPVRLNRFGRSDLARYRNLPTYLFGFARPQASGLRPQTAVISLSEVPPVHVQVVASLQIPCVCGLSGTRSKGIERISSFEHVSFPSSLQASGLDTMIQMVSFGCYFCHRTSEEQFIARGIYRVGQLIRL
jgi:hypothetical protein